MWVLFDLGGVIVDVDLNWSREAWRVTTEGSYSDFDRVFLDSGIKDKIDRGDLSEAAALHAIRALSSASLSDAQIVACWTACLRCRADSAELVREVSQRASCAVLSNTDPMHSGWIEEHSGIREFISRWFYSYQCGSLKPQAAIYRFALDGLATEPQSALLIDDRADNIAAAQTLGIDTIHYTSFAEVCQALLERELLPPDWTPPARASKAQHLGGTRSTQ